MQQYIITRAPLTQLLHNLSEDVGTFFKQEINLLKKEMSEKVSALGRDAMVLGIGNLMAGAGSLLLLASFGFLLAFAFQTAGIHTLLAMFLGFVIVGFVVTVAGAAISVKGIKAISRDSLTPERTIHAVRGGDVLSPAGKEPSAAELHREALATKERIGDERRELTHRISPSQLRERAIEHIRKHSFSYSSAALACGLTGGYFICRKFLRFRPFTAL
jgi:hypothetical protein